MDSECISNSQKALKYITDETQLNWKALEIKYFIVLKVSRMKKKEKSQKFLKGREKVDVEKGMEFMSCFETTDFIELHWPNFQPKAICIPQRGFTVLYRLSGSLPETLIFELAGLICHIFYPGLQVTLV